MTVWFAIPSKRPPEETEPILKLWRERGYRIALWKDDQDLQRDGRAALVEIDELLSASVYPGYANVVNTLAATIIDNHPDVEWIVTGGDDVEPDPNHSAEEIARQCSDHFSIGPQSTPVAVQPAIRHATFGVMQPTGDRWGDDALGQARWPDAPAYIDRICGSPWMGREFCRRMYQGAGPLFHGYRHMFVDEELQAVAKKLGVLLQRRDLIQKHNHCQRNGGPVPEFLKEVYGPAHWREAEALFNSRKALSFPGHEPLFHD